MSATRHYLAQSGHPALLLAPVDVTGGKTSTPFNFSKYQHASILVCLGVSAAAATAILVEACTDNLGTGATAIGFDYFLSGVGDGLGARQTATAAGIAPVSAVANTFYDIEIDSNVLPQGFSYLRVRITNGVNSVIACVFVALSAARYAQDQTPTVLV